MATKPKSKSKKLKLKVAQKRKAPKTTSTDRPDGSPADATTKLVLAPDEKFDLTQTKIFPRNLTARAQFHVVGNPVVTRPEDAVANCYPGLELDIRNLDRRFFPGLVFNFVEQGAFTNAARSGAKLAYIDALEDPDLKSDQKIARALYTELTSGMPGTAGTSLATGAWYLDWIEQGGKRILTRTRKDGYLPGVTVWRLVRGLEPGPASIGLKRRDNKKGAKSVTLKGWRRLFTDPTTGVISGAYQPGELMQGLCSPWQHDFRDCYCHYWASNRPDLVFGDVYPGEPLLPGGDAVDASLNLRLDWMRADRSRELAVAAFAIIEKNRPYQLDAYQINKEWQNLSIVLNGREIDSVHLTEPDEAANPYDSPKKLAEQLRDFLAPLEATFMLEYLYARFSLRDPDKIVGDEQLRQALILAREYLLLIAISEMQHLRWVNEILWELCKAGKVEGYEYKPVIRLADRMPQGMGGPFQGDRTKKVDVAAYIASKRKIRSHPADEAAAAKAVVEFSNVVDKFKRAVEGFEEACPVPHRAPKKDLEEFNEALDKFAGCDPGESPQEALDEFMVALNKFGQAHQGQPPQKSLDALKRDFDKFKEARDRFKMEHPDADPNEWRPRGPYPLTKEVQQAFINVERPNAIVDSTYARVAATLDQAGKYPPHLVGLARRILQDGMQHESRFNAIQAVLKPFYKDETKYLRTIALGSTADPKVKEVLELRNAIVVALRKAYVLAARDDIEKSNKEIADARTNMHELLGKCETLAEHGIGVPFFDNWPR
jgi:hypothetical protein